MEKLIFVIIAMVEHITVDPFELWWYKILLALSVYPFTFNVGLNVIIIITDPRFIIFIKLTMVTFITCIINIITLLALKGIHRPPLSASKTTTWTVSHNIFTIIPFLCKGGIVEFSPTLGVGHFWPVSWNLGHHSFQWAQRSKINCKDWFDLL